VEVIEAAENSVVEIPFERLFIGGEFVIDSRIASRGYFMISIAGGKLQLRSTRFVGLIPLNDNVAVNIRPKATIENIGGMIVRSGRLPSAIDNFTRGYKPLFERASNAIEVYWEPYLSSVQRVLERGLLKRYERVPNPPKWRGRLLISETVKRFAARGIRYRAAFEFTTLSHDISENRLVKAALADVVDWMSNAPSRAAAKARLPFAQSLMRALEDITDLRRPLSAQLGEVPKFVQLLPPYAGHYREALWMAYAILQRAIPDIQRGGYASLTSMIVDVSAVFEGYARTIILERAQEAGLVVRDGNLHHRPFFVGATTPYKVLPDIIIQEKNGTVRAVLDVKYKQSINEQDRYELLAFMEATGATRAAFVCPKFVDEERFQFLGTTRGGRSMTILRVDLATQDLRAEEDRLYSLVEKVLDSQPTQ